MIARVATFDKFPADDRTWVAETAESILGVLGVFHLNDPDTGQGANGVGIRIEGAVELRGRARLSFTASRAGDARLPGWPPPRETAGAPFSYG